MEDKHVPCLALGVISPDGEFTAGYRVTSTENRLPVTPQTLFQIGSISKTFTATVAMMLVERGEFDLRAHPEAAPDYAALKTLAERYRDEREAYTDGKTEFVRAIEARAGSDPA